MRYSCTGEGGGARERSGAHVGIQMKMQFDHPGGENEKGEKRMEL